MSNVADTIAEKIKLERDYLLMKTIIIQSSKISKNEIEILEKLYNNDYNQVLTVLIEKIIRENERSNKKFNNKKLI